jgi:predicted aspartyl protease
MYERVINEQNGSQTMGRFSVEMEVANYADVMMARAKKMPVGKIRKLTLAGVVDPGATRLVLPLAAANQLGLEVTAKTKVKYADGRRTVRDEVEGAYVTIQGRSGDFKAIIEPRRDTALIGAIVLEDLDFLVDCQKHRLVPRDPDFVVSEIE